MKFAGVVFDSCVDKSQFQKSNTCNTCIALLLKITEISAIQSHKNFLCAPESAVCIKTFELTPSGNFALACRISQTSFCKMADSVHMIADVWQVSALPEL